jgi:hypothetical protein
LGGSSVLDSAHKMRPMGASSSGWRMSLVGHSRCLPSFGHACPCAAHLHEPVAGHAAARSPPEGAVSGLCCHMPMRLSPESMSP